MPPRNVRRDLFHEISEEDFGHWFDIKNLHFYYFLVEKRIVSPRSCANKHEMAIFKIETSTDFYWYCVSLCQCENSNKPEHYVCDNVAHIVIRFSENYHCYTLAQCPPSEIRASPSIFSRDTTSQLTIEQTVKFLFFRCWYQHHRSGALYAQVTNEELKPNLIDWMCFIREVLVEYYRDNGNVRIGGADKPVLFAECHYGFRKYFDIGEPNAPTTSKWVYAGVDIDRGDYFFKVYPSNSITYLIDALRSNIREGTKLMFDNLHIKARLGNQRNQIFNELNLTDQRIDLTTDFDHKKLTKVRHHTLHVQQPQRFCSVGYFAFFLMIRICDYAMLDPFCELFRILGQKYPTQNAPNQIISDLYPHIEFRDE